MSAPRVEVTHAEAVRLSLEAEIRAFDQARWMILELGTAPEACERLTVALNIRRRRLATIDPERARWLDELLALEPNKLT